MDILLLVLASVQYTYHDVHNLRKVQVDAFLHEAIERADDLRLAVRAFPVLYLVELGGNHFRIIACHAVNLQGVEPVALDVYKRQQLFSIIF